MKKVLIICAVFVLSALLISQAAFAQKGLKFGMMGSIITGDNLDRVETKNGIVAGYFTHKAFSPTFGMTTELLYSQYGYSQLQTDDNGEDYRGIISLNYLELPVLFKLIFGPEKKFRPNIYAGPSVMYFIHGKVEVEGEDGSLDIKGEWMNSLNYGIAFGGGVEISSFFFDFRFYVGLSKIGKSDQTAVAPDVKHSAYSVSTGIIF
ncbi:porin family protein [candidate division KSB1 bacterium]